MKLFTQTKRVYSHGYLNYIPNFSEVFPELKGVGRDELAERFRKLGIIFYTIEKKPTSVLIRLTMPFAVLVLIGLTLLMPIHYLVVGRWRYQAGTKLFNWLEAVFNL